MKKREYRNIKGLKEIKAKVVEFYDNGMIASSLNYRIPISNWNFNIVKQYYALRKDLRKVNFLKKTNQKNIVLPINAWLLGKYVFETLFVIIHILLLIIYFIKVPVFRGYLSCYMAFFFLSYGILALKVIDYSHKVSYSIKTAIETIDEETKRDKHIKGQNNGSV